VLFSAPILQLVFIKYNALTESAHVGSSSVMMIVRRGVSRVQTRRAPVLLAVMRWGSIPKCLFMHTGIEGCLKPDATELFLGYTASIVR
jgi:hypothetical protein